MNTHSRICVVGALTLCVFLLGCGKPPMYQAQLGKNEQIKPQDAVYLDGAQVGYVKSVREGNGQRIAELVFTDEAMAKDRMKVGVFRVVEDGRVSLHSDKVQANASALQRGAMIPSKTKLEYVFEKYARTPTFIAAGIGLMAVLVLTLVFKSFFRIGLIIVALLLAGITAWGLHPVATPWVEKLYASASEHQSESGAPPVPDAQSDGTPTEPRLTEILHNRPDPAMVSLAGTFAVSFLIFSILLGSGIRAFRKGK